MLYFFHKVNYFTLGYFICFLMLFFHYIFPSISEMMNKNYEIDIINLNKQEDYLKFLNKNNEKLKNNIITLQTNIEKIQEQIEKVKEKSKLKSEIMIYQYNIKRKKQEEIIIDEYKKNYIYNYLRENKKNIIDNFLENYNFKAMEKKINQEINDCMKKLTNNSTNLSSSKKMNGKDIQSIMNKIDNMW